MFNPTKLYNIQLATCQQGAVESVCVRVEQERVLSVALQLLQVALQPRDVGRFRVQRESSGRLRGTPLLDLFKHRLQFPKSLQTGMMQGVQ